MMGIYIPNMNKPKGCGKCEVWSLCHYPKVDGGYDDKVMPDCPLNEIDEEGIQKAKECLTVIKAMWRLFKIKVNESEELKQELLGMDSNLTIIDESYGERANNTRTE